ncbi:cytosolic sulfotransferase 12 [Dorcoceras hygrometricum]|uniref:Sulfotransferase n=1 Tax=Dorcoceras hygrometricum TaxID=472368 RepID=A0A2Z7BT70_9LAMI|nr:cytosolic sulfotransferase 12 [Dorcoceras hygrometricum]
MHKQMSNEMSSPLPKYLLQEQEIFQEFKSLISNLPQDKGMLASSLHQYQGFWYSPKLLQAAILCQQHFQARDSDIFLVSTPKSGATWLKAIIFSLVNRKKHPPDSENHPLISTNPHDLVPFVEVKLYTGYQIPDLESWSSPRLFATHIPYFSLPESVRKSRDCKIVYLCRDPKDVFVSLWHFTNRLRLKEMGTNSLAHVFDRFCNGASILGPFWDHVLLHWNQSKENPDRIFFLKFEDLKRDPQCYLRRLAEFLGCPFSKEEEGLGMMQEILKICSFENLSGLEINRNGKLSSGEENKAFFRRGEVGDWRNYLTDDMAEKLDGISDKKFGGSGSPSLSPFGDPHPYPRGIGSGTESSS